MKFRCFHDFFYLLRIQSVERRESSAVARRLQLIELNVLDGQKALTLYAVGTVESSLFRSFYP
jgi:hypothetical protein